MYGIALAGLVPGTSKVIWVVRDGLGSERSNRASPFRVSRGVRITTIPALEKNISEPFFSRSGPDVFLPDEGLYRSSNEAPPDGLGNVFRPSNPLNGRNLCHA
jgi:hypothetical protein